MVKKEIPERYIKKAILLYQDLNKLRIKKGSQQKDGIEARIGDAMTRMVKKDYNAATCTYPISFYKLLTFCLAERVKHNSGLKDKIQTLGIKEADFEKMFEELLENFPLNEISEVQQLHNEVLYE